MKIKKKILSLFDDLKIIFNENENENENESDDGQYYLEQINNNFKEINEAKSFKDQINILKKVPNLGITGIMSIMKIIKRQILDYIN